MPDGEDHDIIPLEAVTDEIGRDRHEFPPPSRKRPPAKGLRRQAFGRSNEPQRESLRGEGRELTDVVAEAGKITLRAAGSDDPVQGR